MMGSNPSLGVIRNLSPDEMNYLLNPANSSKVCTKCDIDKPFTEYNIRNGTADGYSYQCKECNKENLKNHYYENKEYYVRKSARARKEIKDMVRKLKVDLGCSRCGFNEHYAALDFHHRDGEEKLFNIATGMGYASRKRLLEELEKCDVMCANCHRIETAGS